MKFLYSPNNLAEAHMLVHLLQQNNLDAAIHGEALTGAIGGLPTDNILKISVADNDYEAARQLILDWEVKNPSIDAKQPNNFKMNVACAAIFLIVGFSMGWLMASFHYNKPGNGVNNQNSQVEKHSLVEKIDANGDTKIDAIYKYSSLTALYPDSDQVDTNFDGNFDLFQKYKNGISVYSESDADQNGKIDRKDYYENGVVTRSEFDDDENGFYEEVNLYQKGRLVESQIIHPDNNRPIKIKYYKNNKLVSSDYDEDGDGILETKHQYNQYEEIIR